MEIIKHYRNNDSLRHSFNALAEATFGLNFENWYQNGFWGDNYEPYSIMEDGRIVANVSLNRTEMQIGGETKRLYQLGTVMTAENYRNRGYIRLLMDEIEKNIADADGVYLFANDSVLEFYPKFGFREAKEFVYTKAVSQTGKRTMQQIPMGSAGDWAKLRRAMDANTFSTACRMVNNPGLIFFYVSQFMQDCVYYSQELDAWAIAELEEGELLLHDVFSSREITLEDVIQSFGGEVTHVTLGFTPADPMGYDCREYKDEDCTFFVKGPAFEEFSEKNLRIPTLSHA